MTENQAILMKQVSPYGIAGLKREFILKESEVVRTLTGKIIIRYVCEYFGFERFQLLSKRRFRKYTHARYLAAWIMKNHLELTLKEIADEFYPAFNDHTTSIHAVKFVDGQLSLPCMTKTKSDLKGIMSLLDPNSFASTIKESSAV